MTPLADRLCAMIRLSGPMPVSDFMAACLLDPAHGYYTRAQPFGRTGDFITAPDLSQMFGELVGAFLVGAWHKLGKPDPFVLAEAGPGRGTLMKHALRTIALDAHMRAAARLHLIEASDKMIAMQCQALTDTPVALDPTWCARIDDLPALPTLLVANEFLDALPVRQFVHRQGAWHERVVGIGPDGDLAFGLGSARLPADIVSLIESRETAQDGAVLEWAPAREAFAATLGHHLASHGGAALLIDYGHASTGTGDTLQAVAGHTYQDPLAAPGESDLTSHVDFEAVARAASEAGAMARPLMTQGDFLLSLGLLQRAGRLGADKDAATQQAIRETVDRLAGAGEAAMGTLFKALCLTAPGMDPPEPFATTGDAR